MRVVTSSFLGMAAVGLSLLAGCPDRTISEVNPQQGRVEFKDIPITVNRNIDILFVIDDSPSMADKQNNLATNFPNFINVLNTIEGGLPDVHIGVVSSDVGTKATQDAAPGPAIGSIGQGGCSGTGDSGNLQITGAPVQGTFISDIKLSNGMRQTNYTGDLATVFGQMARVGAGGCGFEQHLESMKRALSTTNTANAGFLRPDAYLAVIFIADEDDCSMSKAALLGPESAALGPQQSFRCTRFGVTCDQGGASTDAMNQVGTKGQCHPNENSQYLEKVQTYVDFLKSVKASDPSKVIVAGIMGTIEPFQVELRSPPNGGAAQQALAHSCTYAGANGAEYSDPPVRLKFLLDQFPNRSTYTTICQQNLSDGLTLIAQLLKTVLGSPCIEGQLADVDPNTAGDQYDCSVSYVINYGKPTQTEQVLPECNAPGPAATNKPCWHIAADMTKCSMAPHLALKTEDASTPPPDTHTVAYCVTEAEDAD
jgi:hypothetical protein